jgi:hypothetical protein
MLPLEEALRFAGENRSELEKVLAHYSSDPNDSLKYRASVFLIENMPGYYSIKTKELDAFRLIVKEFGKRHDYPVTDEHMRIIQPDSFEDKYSIPVVGSSQKIYDSHVITADYLIENIEMAFKVWKEKPWGNSISFDEFCEAILPYRAGYEPLENWRKDYYEAYQPVLDSLLKSEDPIEAGKILYDKILNQRWLFDRDVLNEYMGAQTLLECRIGDCRLIANYATYVFRSVGLPAGIDCILQNPDMMYKQHYWNYMKDSSGRSIPFELYQYSLIEAPKVKRKKGKVYRICYGKQASSIPLKYKGEPIPPLLNDTHLIDVSSSYFEGSTVEIKTGKKRSPSELLYLGVFNNQKWIPIACSKIKGGIAVFPHIESGIVYQALGYQDEKLFSVSVPLLAFGGGMYHFLKPNEDSLQSMLLYRKYPVPEWIEIFKHRSVGGLFQGANKEDFSDAVTLYTTTEELNMYSHRVLIDNPKAFKYVRYYSAPDSHCNMAEVKFVSEGKELRGEIIGTEGSSDHSTSKSKYALFDKDPLTYYDSPLPDWAWAGLKLEDPAVITEIEYQFRTDDNNIRSDDVYELFYFSDKGLISLGKRTGDKREVLLYDRMPANALYWLHNETRGREERIFTYENGKQIFW